MKRVGNLFKRVIAIDNLQLADEKARKGKGYQYGIKVHDRTREANIIALHQMLADKTYTTSPYTVFKIFDPKERDIYRLPYYPDRIVHHAVMNIMEPIFISVLPKNTYSCIKGRGIHAAVRDVQIALRDVPGTQYCLKLDIKKFYPSVDHDILKRLLRKKIKDQSLLWLLDDIIDSTDGLPIGNYLSQYFANFYLAYFDHWLKEVKGIKYYFRYADDLVILGGDKPMLHRLLSEIRKYLSTELNLTVKENYQVFPVASRSIDFLGYRFYHTHIILRKSIKKRFARKVAKGANLSSIASYYGWAKHCSSSHLLKKLLNEKLQTTGNKPSGKKFFRRKNKDRQDIEPADSSRGLQDKRFEI